MAEKREAVARSVLIEAVPLAPPLPGDDSFQDFGFPLGGRVVAPPVGQVSVRKRECVGENGNPATMGSVGR
jgi:hypothetical protein